MASAAKYLSGDVSAIKDFISQFDTFLIDCDGVLWSGNQVFDGIPETISFLQALGKRTVFVTNNSTKTRAENLTKLTSFGIPSTEEDVFGSSYSAAIYISRILKLPPGRNKVYVLGEAGIERELASENIPVVGGTDPSFRRDITDDDIRGIADGTLLDPDVGVVLTGLDFHVNYLKLSHAFHYLRRGAVFLATNTDSTFPMGGTFFPGSGSCSAGLIKMMGGAEPTVLGKPAQAMMEAVEGKFALDRARTCMIGDRLNTDIQFGIDGKLGGTLHVLTGVNRKEDWDFEGAGTVPSFYADRLSDLLLAKE